MCVKFEVFLPTVESFIIITSLQCGSIIICAWTMFRSLFCCGFFLIAICEVLLRQKLIGVFPKHASPVVGGDLVVLYLCFVGMVLVEAFLFMFAVYLAKGLYTMSSGHFVEFLACRIVTWVLELLFMSLICVYDKLLIGWYLMILFFVVLELYSWIVVYSYYFELLEQEKEEEDEKDEVCCVNSSEA